MKLPMQILHRDCTNHVKQQTNEVLALTNCTNTTDYQKTLDSNTGCVINTLTYNPFMNVSPYPLSKCWYIMRHNKIVVLLNLSKERMNTFSAHTLSTSLPIPSSCCFYKVIFSDSYQLPLPFGLFISTLTARTHSTEVLDGSCHIPWAPSTVTIIQSLSLNV
jgi:hypothetical protein